MYVIGTAGHVDHGKSTLVQALTGIDPDRLKEEKAREMTIDLGFAWLKLPGLTNEVGVIDVPGHRDFIENMLAGVGGIDLALLVIAADEGLMPQTGEHLAILDLLQIKGGVVVLTKADLVDDEWLELVMLEVHEALEGTVLAQAPLVSVSARTGRGLTELKNIIAQTLQAIPPRPDNGRARLPIDRIFTLTGFGTVVTGTLLDGQLKVGEMVEVLPSGLTGRVRGLQSHKTKQEIALPGRRVAVNLAGLTKEELKRGDVLALPHTLRPSILIDVQYRHLPSATAPLTHNSRVKLFVGAAEVVARVRVLGENELRPGQTGWIQLALQHPVAVLRGDRFIVRRPSPSATIGGGQILDAHPGRQHRRFRPEVIERLQALEKGTPGDLLLQKLHQLEPITLKKFKSQAGVEEKLFDLALQELESEQLVVWLDQYLVSRPYFTHLTQQLQQTVQSYEQQYPLRPGIPREELRSRHKLAPAVFTPLLAQTELIEQGSMVHTPLHTPQFTPAQQQKITQLRQQLAQAEVNSPAVKEVQAAVGEEVYFALVAIGELVPLNDNVLYTAENLAQFQQILLTYLQEKGEISAAEVRDLLNTSRKYAIALLEYLDDQQITHRVGDVRRLKQ